MSESAPAPKRRFTLKIEWGSDDREGLVHALRHIAFEIESGAPPDRVISGRPRDGGHYELVEDPDMTHERYMAALDRWLAERKGLTSR